MLICIELHIFFAVTLFTFYFQGEFPVQDIQSGEGGLLQVITIRIKLTTRTEPMMIKSSLMIMTMMKPKLMTVINLMT